MLFKREGYPEEGEIVLCTVSKINPNSVFANISDYTKSGMIHISEISPGRIRNIRDYVSEGKVIVCKVLRINKERGYIDLSLRRVNENLRRNKLTEVKQEQKAEKIIEIVAQDAKKDFRKLYSEIAKPIIAEYDMLHLAFIDVALDKIKISDLHIPKEYQKSMDEMIRKRFKPEKIPVGGILTLQTYDANGVEIIKEALADIEKMPNSDVKYLGAGNYRINIDSDDVKKDQKDLDKKIETAIEFIEEHNGSGKFIAEAGEQ